MANRYLRATGAWTGAVWASTISGTAGSAATPTASDDVILNNNGSSYVVTLGADAVCNSVSTAGASGAGQSIVLNGYKLTVTGAVTVYSGGGNAFINVANSTLECTGTVDLSGLTNLSSSTIVLNITANTTFPSYSSTYGNFIINLGGSSEVLTITGAPTFTTLLIQSKNSNAHTVQAETLAMNKFIAIGSSASNRLTILTSRTTNSPPPVWYTISPTSTGSVYGQYIDFDTANGSGIKPRININGGNTPAYLGSNSVPSLYANDPPKISTLIDPLTTAPDSNPNWTVSGGGTIAQITTGIAGGGYSLTTTTSNTKSITSTGTYDMTDSTFIVEHSGFADYGVNMWTYFDWKQFTKQGGSSGSDDLSFYKLSDGTSMGSSGWFSFKGHGKIVINATAKTATYSYMNNMSGAPSAGQWVVLGTDTLSDLDILMLKSVRIKLEKTQANSFVNPSTGYIGSINLRPPLIDTKSATDSGFSSGDPYNSGVKQNYKTQISLDPGIYYWRVRAKDPSGSNQWGGWSETRQFEVIKGGSEFLLFFFT